MNALTTGFKTCIGMTTEPTRLAAMLSIEEVNRMTKEDFIATFANVVENCPLCAAVVWKGRPFKSGEDLADRVAFFLDHLSLEGKECILRLFKEITGRYMAGLSKESQRERNTAGIATLDTAEVQKLRDLNDRYVNKFDFTFVICALLNNIDTIFHGLETLIDNDPVTEVATGINEVKKISRLRFRDIVDPSSKIDGCV